MMALKDIGGGEELLADYGEEYWSVINKKEKEEKKERSRKRRRT